MQLSTYEATVRKIDAVGELEGVPAAISNGTNTFTERYMVSPIGFLFEAANLTIQDSSFSGHATKSKFASGDLINQASSDVPSIYVVVSHTSLLSKHTIIFGYPLDGSSFIKVQSLNNDPSQSFVLYRYDTDYGPSCKVSTVYMALQCPISGGS